MTQKRFDQAEGALHELYAKPSENAWETVLEAALSGDLDPQIDRLGSITNFIFATISNSSFPGDSRIFFDRVLDRRVSMWDFSKPVAFKTAERRLELIASFKPESGFHVVLGQLSSVGKFYTEPWVSDREGRSLFDQALHCLERYFPTGFIEPTKNEAFKNYTNFLFDLTKRHSYRAVACRRLFELGRWTTDQTFPVSFVEFHFREVAPELVKGLVASEWSYRDKLLSYMYAMSQPDEARFAFFKKVLERYSARLDEDPDSPQIILYQAGQVRDRISAFLTGKEYNFIVKARNSESELLAAKERVAEFSKKEYA